MTVPGLVVVKRLRLEGFIVTDFYDRRAEAETRLARWIAEGRIKAEVDIFDGLERAPDALIGLFEGPTAASARCGSEAIFRWGRATLVARLPHGCRTP